MRSNSPEVRNPLLCLGAAVALIELPVDARVALRKALLVLRSQAQTDAAAHYPRRVSTAAHWKCVAVYLGHVVRLLGADAKARAGRGGPIPVTSASSAGGGGMLRKALLSLPSPAALTAVPPEALAALRNLLVDLRADALKRSEKSWVTHKAPLSSYWVCVALYAGLAARSLRSLHAG